MDITDILNKFKAFAANPREQGTLFEKFIKGYFLNVPTFQVEKVWRWTEFPYRGGVPDIGIDLVALTTTGDYLAIQCKFYDENATISKGDIDSFLSASQMGFTDNNGKRCEYSARYVVATCKVGNNAKVTMDCSHTNVLYIREKNNTGIDWDNFWDWLVKDLTVDVRTTKHELLEHQQRALNDVVTGFKKADRGKLVMACGTGKTFTSLRITEKLVPNGGIALYLVPSLSLLGQTLSCWTIDAVKPIKPILVCSDTSINTLDSRRRTALLEDSFDIHASDLALPASTSAKDIVKQYQRFNTNNKGITVIFSTYQSIQAVCDAQKKGLPEFDLIVCDEAHRTTGITVENKNEDVSAFMIVHDNKKIKAKKRLYMTATPRIYGEATKNRVAKEKSNNSKDGLIVLYSMDDETIYGKEFHKLSFPDAVKQGLLTDYKVVVLTVKEGDIKRYTQQSKLDSIDFDKIRELNPRFKKANDDDIKEFYLSTWTQLVGCWLGLAKQGKYFDKKMHLVNDFAADPVPMSKAVVFSSTIKFSRDIVTPWFKDVSQAMEDLQKKRRIENPNFREPKLALEVKHIDGTVDANQRAMDLNWLKDNANNDDSNNDNTNKKDSGKQTCKILSNVRCLSEGVDVPALDAVIFLSPRNSMVDVIQSIGRVMRKAPGKKYGYIILPVAIPESVDPQDVLNNNDRFEVVWKVLQALRCHDDNLKIEINKLRFEDDTPTPPGPEPDTPIQIPSPRLYFEDYTGENYAKLVKAKVVQRCGDRDYLEESAKVVALIADTHIKHIKKQLEKPTPEQKKAFEEFLAKLQAELNPSIDKNQAIEMISQHIVMQPVLDSLFSNYQFVKKNVVSQAFEKLLQVFITESSQEEWEKLEHVREEIRARVEGLTSLKSKQQVIVTLYDQFFKTAAKKTAEKLGIVYTPVEVVDFIIHSVQHVLQTEFKKSMNDRNVHILDPFTGTGTFIVRLLQSGIIKPDGGNFVYKFNHELHANEIVLLAYYIAAINIEEAFHTIGKKKMYQPFPGLALTDTFQMMEKDLPENAKRSKNIWGEINVEEVENNQRIINQRRQTIEVIIGNPPYSIGQTSANDNNQNQKYPRLDSLIEHTYAAKSSANLKKGLYDSYIKAFRWASDRLGNPDSTDKRGVIGFVTNGSWLDGNSQDGLRKCFEQEFTSIYVFNLRGNQRTSGELSRKEGGKIFGSGSRAPIAITILVKNPDKRGQKCQIFYRDIGDYLNREQKLEIVKDLHDISNPEMHLTTITPNKYGDWINQRGDEFPTFYMLSSKEKSVEECTFFNPIYSLGIATNRDVWLYGFSQKQLTEQIQAMIRFYNNQRNLYNNKLNRSITPKDYVTYDPTQISWTDLVLRDLGQNKERVFNPTCFVNAVYRPFCHQYLYYDKPFIQRTYQMPKLFPTNSTQNLFICVNGLGIKKGFSCIISNTIVDLNTLEAGTQCFPLYYYEPVDNSTLFDGNSEDVIDGYIRYDGITDSILEEAKKKYNVTSITKENLFYYVYGFLHSPDYRSKFEADLKSSLARIPLVKKYEHFDQFVTAGEQLAELHLNYDSPEKLKAALKRINKNITNKFVATPIKVVVRGNKNIDVATVYHVEKMTFAKNGKVEDRTRIIYNQYITLEEIPEEAYTYIVNGKSAIEWIMERYAVKTDKDSGITNDPNLWNDGKTPKYIVELLESVITVSMITNRIVSSLPQWTA